MLGVLRFPVALVISVALCLVGCDDEDSCFAVGTRVLTPDGPVAIETLRVGDPIIAFDAVRRAPVTSRVTRTWRHADRPYRMLALPGGRTLGVTATHPVFDLETARYAPVAEVAARGALAMLSADSTLVPASTSWDAGIVTHGDVIDIAVEDHANFFAEGVLVHNKSFDAPIRLDAAPVDAP